jgi:hypothetical protein
MVTVWPSEVPLMGEVSMPSDLSTIAFQKYYRAAFGAGREAANQGKQPESRILVTDSQVE